MKGNRIEEKMNKNSWSWIVHIPLITLGCDTGTAAAAAFCTGTDAEECFSSALVVELVLTS